jgi:hypothetical protein
LKSENLVPPSKELAEEYGLSVEPSSHGHDGPVDVTYPKYIPLYVPCCFNILWWKLKAYPRQHQTLVKAAQELGHDYNHDPYSGNPIGVTYSLSSQTKQAVRETAEFAYRTSISF